MSKQSLNAARIRKATQFAVLANLIEASKRDEIPRKFVRYIKEYAKLFKAASRNPEIGAYMGAMAKVAVELERYCNAHNKGDMVRAKRSMSEVHRLQRQVEVIVKEMSDNGCD